MVISSDPAWLQGAFSALIAIFNRVGLRTNVNKTVSMACHPCRARSGNWTTAGYSRRLTGSGKHSRRDREREWRAGIVGRKSRLDPCRVTWWLDMGRPQHGSTSGPPIRLGSPGCTKWVFLRGTAGDSARWRDARGCQQHKRRCGCTLCTGTSTTPWLYWRKATSSYHGSPSATFRYPGRRLTGATWRPVSAGKGRSGSEGG